MVEKNYEQERDETVEKLVDEYREELKELFFKDTFELTFNEREKLIDSKLDKGRCKILEQHIEKDPDGISKNNNHPDETSLCHCGACSPLCRDEKGNPKMFDREIKTKRGIVITKEHGYYCSKCRKVFFPSPQKVRTIQRKLQP